MDNFDLKKYLVENKVTTNSRMMNEAFEDFNPAGFSAAIKETLKKLQYQVKDMSGSSIDPAKNELEKAANEGKKEAVVGVLEWEDGQEVVAAISIPQQSNTQVVLQTMKELEDKVYNVYSKEFSTRFNKTNNGRVVVIGVKERK
jgi:hypothetical protein